MYFIKKSEGVLCHPELLFFCGCSHRDADTDSVNTMVVHEDEAEVEEGEQAGGYGDQTMLVQRVSHLY